MTYLANVARVDHLLCQRDRWTAAVVEVDHVLDARLAHCREHFLAVGDRKCQRLLAVDVLASLRGGDADFSVRMARSRHVDQVDIFASDCRFPIGRGVLPSPAFCELTNGCFVATTDDLHYRLGVEVEKPTHCRPRLAVRFAHEFVTDEADVQTLFGHVRWFSLRVVEEKVTRGLRILAAKHEARRLGASPHCQTVG